MELLATTEHRQAPCSFMCRQVGKRGEHSAEVFPQQEKSGPWRQQQLTTQQERQKEIARRSTEDERSTRSFSPPALTGVGGGAPLQWRACASRRQRSSIFVRLYAEDDEVVGAAPGLLLQQSAAAQVRRLARHRHVSRQPLLAVFVHQPVPPAGGAVPDAFLGPVGWMASRR